MKEIPLTQGKVAIVDDYWYEYLNKWNWYYDCGYAVRQAPRQGKKRTLILMHRVITNAGADFEVDHINGDKLFNLESNLRVCNRSENSRNSAKRERTTSRFKGVSWHRNTGKWQAQIRANGRETYLGVFETQEGAAVAYDKAARKFFGEFARINNMEVV